MIAPPWRPVAVQDRPSVPQEVSSGCLLRCFEAVAGGFSCALPYRARRAASLGGEMVPVESALFRLPQRSAPTREFLSHRNATTLRLSPFQPRVCAHVTVRAAPPDIVQGHSSSSSHRIRRGRSLLHQHSHAGAALTLFKQPSSSIVVRHRYPKPRRAPDSLPTSAFRMAGSPWSAVGASNIW